ncbi:MAG: glycosyltransferase family 2 protein [Rhodospirillales bacterium]|nr:glycosyltransferase family 2 protein [Rhodospirillales bacterium]
MPETDSRHVDYNTVPDITVVVPVKNEAENIEPLITEIRAALDGGAPYEIIYIDDGSTDATPAELEKQFHDGAPLRVIRHDKSCGQSAAVISGVTVARGHIIATLDGDGQNDPADLPEMIKRFRRDSDYDNLMIAGWRTKRRDILIKRFSSKFANGLRKRLLKDNTPDTGCGIKVFSHASFMAMPHFDHMHRFLPALIIRGGGEVISVPVNHRHRERGVSNYGTLDRAWASIWDLMGMIWLLRRGNRPSSIEVRFERERQER